MKITDTTLVCVDCLYHHSSMRAMLKNMEQLQFDKCLFLTDIAFTSPGIEVVQVPRICSKEEYSQFVMKELVNYIDTKYLLLIQWDGYVINPHRWQEDWKQYDYIGAPWWYGDGLNVGNGGFSFRSLRLMQALRSPLFPQTHPEDDRICRSYRPQLERLFSIKFAPEEVAALFSWEPNAKYRIPVDQPFGFHGVPDLILK